MLCWNIATMPRAERAVAIGAAERDIAKTDEDREAFRDLVELMLARYEELFSQPWRGTLGESPRRGVLRASSPGYAPNPSRASLDANYPRIVSSRIERHRPVSIGNYGACTVTPRRPSGGGRARARIAAVATGTNIDDLLTAIRSLPLPERLRLVERVVHEAAEQSEGANGSERSAILGLFADEPGLMDEVCESAMQSRERDPLRRRG